jgi:hypothetical protein
MKKELLFGYINAVIAASHAQLTVVYALVCCCDTSRCWVFGVVPVPVSSSHCRFVAAKLTPHESQQQLGV